MNYWNLDQPKNKTNYIGITACLIVNESIRYTNTLNIYFSKRDKIARMKIEKRT